MTTSNLELAQEKLAHALTEHVQAPLAEQDQPDPESQRYLLRDLNGLLATAGPGAELQPKHLKSPTRLLPHLRASLEIPTQVLARELPGRLSKWLKAEPKAGSPERPAWVEQGRWLLDQARTNPSNLT